VTGDASDDFKFSSFFPSMLAPIIDGVAGVCGTMTRLRHVPGEAPTRVVVTCLPRGCAGRMHVPRFVI
jgi:hypothetical protein